MLRDHEVEFEIPEKEELASYEISALSERLMYLIDEEGEEGDDTELEEFLDQLGEIQIRDGKVLWSPPKGLDPLHIRFFQDSVDALNRYIQAGKLSITTDGRIVQHETCGEKSSGSLTFE